MKGNAKNLVLSHPLGDLGERTGFINDLWLEGSAQSSVDFLVAIIEMVQHSCDEVK